MAFYQSPLNADMPSPVRENLEELLAIYQQSSPDTPDALWERHRALIEFIYKESRQYQLIWVLASTLDLSCRNSLNIAVTDPGRILGEPERAPRRKLSLSVRRHVAPPRIPARVASPPVFSEHATEDSANLQISRDSEEQMSVNFLLRQDGVLMAGTTSHDEPDHSLVIRTERAAEYCASLKHLIWLTLLTPTSIRKVHLWLFRRITHKPLLIPRMSTDK